MENMKEIIKKLKCCVVRKPPYTNDVTNIKGLVTNYGEAGGYKTGGGAHEVLPLEKGGGRKKF